LPRRAWIAALTVWPGLPQIWSGQEVLGLTLATLFALSLNVFLVSRFIWTEAFPVGFSGACLTLAVCGWLGGCGYTLWWVWSRHPEGHRPEIDRLFRDATDSYLRGKYQEARRQLERIVEMDDNDADALMQLGTLFVRTEQPALARRTFRQCLELEGGAKWRWEIQQMLDRLGKTATVRIGVDPTG